MCTRKGNTRVWSSAYLLQQLSVCLPPPKKPTLFFRRLWLVLLLHAAVNMQPPITKLQVQTIPCVKIQANHTHHAIQHCTEYQEDTSCLFIHRIYTHTYSRKYKLSGCAMSRRSAAGTSRILLSISTSALYVANAIHSFTRFDSFKSPRIRLPS